MPKQQTASERLAKRYGEGNPKFAALLEQAREGARVSRQVYELRTRAGLSQAELARLVNTSPSVISRIEDDDYDRHSLTMLRRVAAALGFEVSVTFRPILADDEEGGALVEAEPALGSADPVSRGS